MSRTPHRLLRRPVLAAGGLALVLTVAVLLPAHEARAHGCDAQAGPGDCEICLHAHANPAAATAAPVLDAPAATGFVPAVPAPDHVVLRPAAPRGRAPPAPPATV